MSLYLLSSFGNSKTRVLEKSKEIFSFHLLRLPLWGVPGFLLNPMHAKKIDGLLHSESFLTMKLGEPIASAPRYSFRNLAFFAWWRDETVLDAFLNHPSSRLIAEGWHVRMRLYRRWGEISELKTAAVDPALSSPDSPMIAVTLARLNLRQTHRFIQFGKPVESQVRDHSGQVLALAAIRPLNTFSTFSIWKTESDLTGMVFGKDRMHDGESHKLAMQERLRKDFHHEFSTMRFAPFKEVGVWNKMAGYTTGAPHRV